MERLRTVRIEAGLTQAELAGRARVSRQLVGAVETGRHLPRVDAAMALAAALDVEVAELFGSTDAAVDIASGSVPTSGALVRVGRVGDQAVTAPARIGPDGWDVADAVVDGGTLDRFTADIPGMVVAGCEPGLELIERILREGGMAAVSAMASSKCAIEALAAGRVHAAVVHGPALSDGKSRDGLHVDRIHLTRWQVGLATAADAARGWWQEALSGSVSVVQREEGAGVQRTFQAATGSDRVVAGPRVASHYEAAQRATLTKMAAVTIEPAALALGAQFHPLASHDAQLWIDKRWATDRATAAALDVLGSRRFQQRLRAVGGYDLERCGVAVS